MRTVLCHGVFDLLHVGHVEHLRQARTFGDVVLVSVVPDRFAKRRPIYDEVSRLLLLQAIKYVDRAYLCNGPGPEYLIEGLMPSIYVRNDEYLAQDKPEYALIKRLGIEVGFTKTVPPHTSEILARIRAK